MYLNLLFSGAQVIPLYLCLLYHFMFTLPLRGLVHYRYHCRNDTVSSRHILISLCLCLVYYTKSTAPCLSLLVRNLPYVQLTISILYNIINKILKIPVLCCWFGKINQLRKAQVNFCQANNPSVPLPYGTPFLRGPHRQGARRG